MRILKRNIQEKFEKIWSRFVEEETFFFLIFPPNGTMLRKRKQFDKIQDLKISKSEKVTL